MTMGIDMSEATAQPFHGWSIVEVMGHRQTCGMVTEVMIAGAQMLRVDVPGDGDGVILATQYYSPASIYCLTPTTEGIVRRLLERQPGGLPPAVRLHLPAPAAPPPHHLDDDYPEDAADIDDEEF